MVDEQNPIRILIVDDEEIIRYGLNAILKDEKEIDVVGEAQNGEQAVAQVKLKEPDIVLMDINMPLMNGVTATEEICRDYPDVKVLILTTSTENHHLYDALQSGASGYLLKNIPPADFIHIIQNTYRGYMQFDPLMGKKIQSNKPSASPETISYWKELTPREKEVARLIAEGNKNREIAEKLHISEKTVKNHVSNILSRAGSKNRTQLAIWINSIPLDIR